MYLNKIDPINGRSIWPKSVVGRPKKNRMRGNFLQSHVQSVITRGTIPKHVKRNEVLVKLEQRGRHMERGRRRERERGLEILLSS
uniref:Uncharacterized protein n=1 Tax=Lactuca sativa TaxID=4236 RepID=A0A9R1XSP1_LACSA|nr:hypothetical protein LSAT_V11C100013530 [Lactuca sativa]